MGYTNLQEASYVTNPPISQPLWGIIHGSGGFDREFHGVDLCLGGR